MIDFDKILLYHPQRNLTYIRKLTMSYGYYTVLATVNKDHQVTNIGINNTLQILPYGRLNVEDQRTLGKKKCEQLQPNDLLNIYRINKAVKLKRPFRLYKKCNSMRYTTPEETLMLKKEMLKNKDNIIINKENKLYKDTYTDETNVNLDDINISKELEQVTLPNYDNLLAQGQTRLI